MRIGGPVTGDRITINDVADAAGVSRQTVTRAMNEMADIAPATRARVLHYAAELGYRPSRFASNLARQKTHAVGVSVASLRNPYFTDMAADLIDAIQERGWQAQMTSSRSSGDAEVIRFLSAHVDAIVGHFDEEESVLAAAGKGLPIVLLEREAHLPGLHSVELDLEQGVATMLGELRARGSRRFGMIDSNYTVAGLGHYEASPRRGYYESSTDPESARAVVVGEESIGGGSAALTALLKQHPETDTVLVFNDLMALGAIQAAHTMRLEIPGRIRIVGIDGLSLGEAVAPALTTLAIDRTALAAAAVDIVAEVFADPAGARSTSKHRVVLPTPLWRGSA